MQAVHSAEEVVRSIGDSLSVCFTGVRLSPPPYAAPISEAVLAAGPETPVELDGLLLMIGEENMTGLRRLRMLIMRPVFSRMKGSMLL